MWKVSGLHSEKIEVKVSLFELPLLPAHGALLLDLLRVQPLQDAVHVEAVRALTPDQRAVVSRDFTCTWKAERQHDVVKASVSVLPFLSSSSPKN